MGGADPIQRCNFGAVEVSSVMVEILGAEMKMPAQQGHVSIFYFHSFILSFFC